MILLHRLKHDAGDTEDAVVVVCADGENGFGGRSHGRAGPVRNGSRWFNSKNAKAPRPKAIGRDAVEVERLDPKPLNVGANGR